MFSMNNKQKMPKHRQNGQFFKLKGPSCEKRKLSILIKKFGNSLRIRLESQKPQNKPEKSRKKCSTEVKTRNKAPLRLGSGKKTD